MVPELLDLRLLLVLEDSACNSAFEGHSKLWYKTDACLLWCLERKERKSTLLSVITGTKQPLSSPGADDQSEGLTRDLSNHRFPTTLI